MDVVGGAFDYLMVNHPFRIHYTGDGSRMQVQLLFGADVEVAAVALQLRYVSKVPSKDAS